MPKIWGKLLQFVRGGITGQVPASMTCREFEDFIVSYLDGSLDESIRKGFEGHIKTCQACREYLAAYQRTIVVGKRVLEDFDKIPGNVPEDLVLAVLKVRYSD